MRSSKQTEAFMHSPTHHPQQHSLKIHTDSSFILAKGEKSHSQTGKPVHSPFSKGRNASSGVSLAPYEYLPPSTLPQGTLALNNVRTRATFSPLPSFLFTLSERAWIYKKNFLSNELGFHSSPLLTHIHPPRRYRSGKCLAFPPRGWLYLLVH